VACAEKPISSSRRSRASRRGGVDEIDHAVGVGTVDALTGGAQDQLAQMVEARLGLAAGVLEAAVIGDAAADFGFEPGVVVAQDVARALDIELIADARKNDGRLDRLDEVIHRAERQTVLLVTRITERGQE
jgi:hypothetical protein